jgi:hypothetical protein
MDEVLVRGHVGKWSVAVRALAIVGLISGVAIMFVDHLAGEIVLGISIVILAILEPYLAVRRRQRLWVQDLGNGLLVRDASGSRQYADEDVYGLDFHAANEYSQGDFKGIRRRFVAKIEGESRPLEMNNLIKPNEADPLQPLITRLLGNYRSGVNEALQAGTSLSGKNWSLSQHALTAQGREAQTIPIDDIVSVTEMDNHVCVWRRGEAEATFRTPVGSPNAFLLQLILAERIESRGEEAAAETEGLGRVMFERRSSKVVRLLLWVVGLLLFPIAAILLLGGLAKGDMAMLAVGVCVLALFALLVWAVRGMGRSVFRAHERGVFRRGFRSSTELLYDEVEQFIYSAVRQYYNGVYVGTALNITLIPPVASGKKPIRFSSSVKNADEALDKMRDHISLVLAAKMLAQLSDGQRVNWTANLVLTPEGIEFRPSGFVRRKEAVLLPFSRVHTFDIQQGTFYLWEQGKDKPVMQEASSMPNFFPGYVALCQIFAPSEAKN